MSTEADLTVAPTGEDVAPTHFIDSDHEAIVEFVNDVTTGAADDRAKAVALFNAVRDAIRYDPYDVSREADDFKASAALAGAQKWCVPKATLLTAAARAAGIPARLGFADVKNHLQSGKLSDHMGTDLFVYHGYSVLHIDGEWRKASPAFNRSLCERFGTKVLEFDGRSDALLHPHDEAGNRHMEYVNDRGVHRDLPLEDILATFDEIYPEMGRRTGDDHDEMFHG